MVDATPQNQRDERPEFSVIVPCFEEEASVEEFHAKLGAALTDIGRSFEIIYVNDGSSDGTLARLQEIFERDAQSRLQSQFPGGIGEFSGRYGVPGENRCG